MGFIKKLLFLLTALFAFIVALLAAADNSAEVALKFLDYESPEWPIAWWITSTFIAGIVFGNLLNVVSDAGLRLGARNKSKIAHGRTQDLDKPKADAGPARPAER
jgi:uncharacterized integral membrane protein